MPRQSPRQYTRKSPAPPQPAVWVVVADAGQARIFAAAAGNGALTEVKDLINADARRQARDVESDRPGRVRGRADGAVSTLEPEQSYAEHVATVFARRLARHLAAARRSGSVGSLHLVADPAFMGRLRASLDAPTRRMIASERVRDFVHRDVSELRSALPARL